MTNNGTTEILSKTHNKPALSFFDPAPEELAAAPMTMEALREYRQHLPRFDPSVKQRAAIAASEIVQSPLQRFDLLASYGQVHVIFCLPWAEPEITPEQAVIAELTATVQAQQRRLNELERQLQARKSSLAVPEQSRRAASRRRRDWDPIFPVTTARPTPALKEMLRLYAWHLITWQPDLPIARQMAWGQKAQALVERLAYLIVARAGTIGLTVDETDYFEHWLRLCVVNPRWSDR